MLLIYVRSDDSNRDGDVQRYLALARTHMPLLQYKARQCGVERYDVDDVVEDGLVAAIVLPSDKPPPPPNDEDAVKAWLVKHVETAAKRHVSKQRRAKVSPCEDPDSINDFIDERNHAAALEHRKSLVLGLQKVRAEHAEVLLEHEIEGVPIAKFARERNIPLATAYSHWRRGRRELRMALEELEIAGVNPRRRDGAFLPFWPEACERIRGIRSELVRLAGGLLRAPLRHALGFVAAAAVTLTLPDPAPVVAVDEPLGKSVAENARVLATRNLTHSSNPRSSPSLETKGDLVTVKARLPARRLDTTPPHDSRNSPSASAWDVSLSLQASTAAAQGNGRRAKALLDADMRKRPDALDVRARETLSGAMR